MKRAELSNNSLSQSSPSKQLGIGVYHFYQGHWVTWPSTTQCVILDPSTDALYWRMKMNSV